MAETPNFKVPYPDRNQLDSYDSFESMVTRLDALDLGSFEQRNGVIWGGGNVTWDATGNDRATWDADVVIATPKFGSKVTIPPSASLASAVGGGISIPAGHFMYAEITRGSTTALTLTDVTSAPQLPLTDNAQVLAYHNASDGYLYWATGLLMPSGGSTTTGIVPNTVITNNIATTDATAIRGVTIAAAAATPSNGDVLVYDSATAEWVVTSPAPGTTYNYVVGKGNYAGYNPNNGAGRQTIADAITDATAVIDPNAGITAVIYVQEGTYTENLTIPAGVSLVGAGVNWGVDTHTSRTKIVGEHSITPFTHGGGVIVNEYASTQLKDLEFETVHSALALPTFTVSDVGLGVQAKANVSFENCVRHQTQDVVAATVEDMTPFLSAVLVNATASIAISNCKISGGYPKAHGVTFNDYACLRLEGQIFTSIADSRISYDAAPLAFAIPYVGPAIKMVGASNQIDIRKSVLTGGVYSEGGYFQITESVWEARWVDGADQAHAGFYVAGSPVLVVTESTLLSSASTIDGLHWFAHTFSGTPQAQLSDVLFTSSTLGYGSGFRAGVDSGFAAVGTDITTPVASYSFQLPGSDTGDPTTESGQYHTGNTKITGKLTVTGLIDPTGLILEEEAPGNVPTGANKGAIFVGDGTGGTTANELYYKNGAGSLTNMTGNVAADVSESYVVMSASTDLTNERVLTGSAAINLNDGGAGGNVEVSLTNTGVTPGSYTKATVTVDAQGRVTSASAGGSNGLIPSEALIARRTEISTTHTVDSQPDPDVIIGVDTSSGAVIVNLPSAALQTSGRLLVIHDLGDAGTNKIGLNPDGSDTINGAVNGTDGSGNIVYALEITIDYGSATLVCDGVSGWFVIATI